MSSIRFAQIRLYHFGQRGKENGSLVIHCYGNRKSFKCRKIRANDNCINIILYSIYTMNVIKMPCTTEIFESVDFNAITLPQAAQNDVAQYVKYFWHWTLATVLFAGCVIITDIKARRRQIWLHALDHKCHATRYSAPRAIHRSKKKLQFVNEKQHVTVARARGNPLNRIDWDKNRIT